MHGCRLCCLLLLFVAGVSHAGVAKGPETLTIRLSGLCYPERADELRELLKDHQKVKLEKIDYERAEGTFTFENVREFSTESLHYAIAVKGFGTRPELKTPLEKLTTLEIGVLGLDCKGCCLGVYNAVARVEGVERATVNLKESRLTVLIDPAKTNRAALEEALKKARVQLKKP